MLGAERFLPSYNFLMLLHGIFPPITTPFYPDGKIYFRKLEQNVEHYSRTPVAGIVVLGSTGEAILLSDEERREVLKCARESAANEKVLIAGTGIESAIETLRLTEYAAELGYDIAMVRTPHYYKGRWRIRRTCWRSIALSAIARRCRSSSTTSRRRRDTTFLLK